MGPPTLETMILSNEHTFHNKPTYQRPRFDNLPPGEWRALYDLKQNEKIVMKSADKGNVVCALQYADYISDGLRQLTDTKFYQPVDTNLAEKHRKEV